MYSVLLYMFYPTGAAKRLLFLFYHKGEKTMGLIELFILAVGLSMDAFAVSVCKGLAMPKITVKKTLIVGLWFGGFQALMPALGYFLGVQFRDKITAIDHWIAFILLGIIGANMIKEACSGECEEENESLDIKTMFLLAVATSIDALAVGSPSLFSTCTCSQQYPLSGSRHSPCPPSA